MAVHRLVQQACGSFQVVPGIAAGLAGKDSAAAVVAGVVGTVEEDSLKELLRVGSWAVVVAQVLAVQPQLVENTLVLPPADQKALEPSPVDWEMVADDH